MSATLRTLASAALALAVAGGCSTRPYDPLADLEDLPPPRLPDRDAGERGDALVLEAGPAGPSAAIDAWGLTTREELVHVWRDGVTTHVERVGAVTCPLPQEPVYELAQDSTGELVATTHAHLVRVDPLTAQCKVLAPLVGLPGPLEALAFLPVDVLEAGKQVLVGITNGGTYVRVERQSGVVTTVGSLSSDGGVALALVGDMTFAGGRLLVSARPAGGTQMGIYELDARSGRVLSTVVPSTSLYQLWGLGAGGPHLVLFTAFSGTGNVRELDPASVAPVPAEVAPDLDPSLSFYAGASRPSM
jgi:hypothetical protein